MSATIDEKVVEMRFDNKQFESNVATSMSTLDKLKQKLNFSGASKGLEDINKASKSVDMSHIGGAVDTIKAKFSALDVVAITALSNITNQAVNAGKRMVSALTIDPVKSGFREYETQINSVQTILANTSSKGTTIDDVTKALDELNKYADLTIYNFTEMTRNIGTFTAAGIDLDTSVNAIQGIANLAAVSGSTSQQASVAMYQLSQALSSGTVRLMDWNSVVNAGMGGEVFQNALKETSRLLGTGADAAIEASGSFRESLSKGWLTAEVLTETLKKFTTSGANEYVAKYTGLSVEAVEAALKNAEAQYGEANAVEEASKALAKKSGKNKDEIKAVLQMAQTATDAATKVKTFSQLWDVMKEAAQSGWAKTWQIIIGDFEEAKSLLTPLADFFTNIIGKMSDWRNNLLESALGKGFDNLAEKITGLLKPAEKAIDTVSKVTDTIGDLGDIVDKVIAGDFGNGEDRFNALTKAGENYYKIQNKVNETLGCSFRYSEEQIAAQDKLLGSQEKTSESTEEATEETEKLTDAQKEQIKTLVKLSEEELRAKGCTDEQIEAFRELKNTAEKLGIPLDDFIDNLDEINGRWLLMNSFKNVGKALIKVFTSIGKAWREIFDPIQSDEIFNVIAAIHKFTASLIPSEETAKKLTRTFKGLFAILDIIRTAVGGGLKIAFKVLSAVLSSFDLNILDVTANIGDALVAFHDWLLEGNALAKAINGLIDKLPSLVEKFNEWFDAFKQTPAVKKLVEAINAISEAFDKLTSGEINLSEFASSFGENLAKALKSIPEIAIQISKDFIEGFQNGIGDSIGGIIDDVVQFCLDFIASFAEALGVQSPSWKAYDTATDFFQGFINGAKDMIGSVLDILKRIGEEIIKAFKSFWDFITDENGNIEWGKIFAGGIIVAMLLVLKQIATAFNGIANALGGIDDLILGASKVLKSFSKVLNGIAWDLKAEALMKMAIAIGILVASIWVLTTIDDIGKLWNAVGVIFVLAAIVAALAWAMGKMSDASVDFDAKAKTFKASGLQKSLLQIGLTILALAYAVKLIGDLDPDKAKKGFIGLAGVAAGLIIFLAAMGGISRYSGDANSVGKMMLKIAVAMGVMVIVLKMISKMDPGDIVIGIAVMETFVLLCIEIGIANRIAGMFGDNFGGNVLKISVAIGIMAFVMKTISGMDPEDIVVGIAALQAFVILIGEMAIINRLAGENQTNFGGTIMSMATSMMIMASVIWILSKMDEGAIDKGIKIMQKFVLLIGEMILVSKLAGKESAKIAGNILAMSAAIVILAGVAILLSLIDIKSLGKGIIAVAALGLIMSAMIAATKGTKNVKGNLIAMTVAIAIMAAAVVALSYIDGSKLAGATAAIGSLMLIFGLMTKLSSCASASIKSMIIMLGVVAILAGLLLILNSLDIGPTLEIAASISMLMLALSASLALITVVGPLASTALTGIGMMTLVLAGIAIVLGILVNIPNIDSALSVSTALSKLLLSLSAACLVIAAGSAIMTVAGAGIGIMIGVIIAMGALMAAIAGLVTLIPDLETFLGKALPILKLVGQGIGEFIGGIVLGIGTAVLQLLPNLGLALSAFMVGVQPFIALSSNVDSSVVAGAGYLTAAILCLTVANFISGISQFMNGGVSFADLGMQLMLFGSGAMGFLNMIKGVDASAVEAASNIADMILVLTASDVISSIVEKFGGSVDFSTMGQNLQSFGDAVVGFSSTISGNIDVAAVEAATNAGLLLVELNKSLPRSGGWVQDIIGEKDFGKFAESCKAFATCILGINEVVSQEGFVIQSEKISQLVTAGTQFSELNNSLPRTGGIAQDLAGEKDLAGFGAACIAFATCMIGINAAVSGDKFVVQSDKISQLVTAGTQFNDLNKALPKTGGIAQDFAGEQDLARFGASVAAFAGCMILVNQAISGDSFSVNLEGIEDLKQAGMKMEELQSILPKSGGWWQNIAGEQDIGDFGSKIKTFSDAIVDFSTSVTGLNNSGINFAITTAYRIKNLVASLSDLDTSGLAEFTGIGTGGFGADGAAYEIAQTIAEFSNKVADINTQAVSVAVSSAQKLKSLIASLVGLDTSGVSSFKSAINDLSGANVSDFVKAFSGVSSKLTLVGADMITSLIKGMQSKLPAITSCLSSAVTNIRTYYASFYSAGSYLADGLANGISANAYKATAKAKAMAESSVKAVREALKINSPSKVFRDIGSGIPEGFAMGISMLSGDVKDSVTDMTSTAVKATKSTMSTVLDALSADIDAQPTIRPVIDLTDVQTGANALNGMLNGVQTIGVRSNLNAINSAINAKLQNGSNDDVISAIDKLRGSLETNRGDVYNFGDFTYDDGDNISDAVRTLVRAAKMGRRV